LVARWYQWHFFVLRNWQIRNDIFVNKVLHSSETCPKVRFYVYYLKTCHGADSCLSASYTTIKFIKISWSANQFLKLTDSPRSSVFATMRWDWLIHNEMQLMEIVCFKLVVGPFYRLPYTLRAFHLFYTSLYWEEWSIVRKG
jgi:hypothetical protein